MLNSSSSSNSTTSPMTEDAHKYLAKHKIPQLMNHLLSQLVYAQPANPRDYLIKELGVIAQKRNAPASSTTNPSQNNNANNQHHVPTIFTKDNLAALFRIFDTNGKGFLSLEEYNTAMQTLSIPLHLVNQHPRGATFNKIDMTTFVDEGLAALAKQ